MSSEIIDQLTEEKVKPEMNKPACNFPPSFGAPAAGRGPGRGNRPKV